MRGKYTSLTTPPVRVNHTGQGEAAEPTASLFPRVIARARNCREGRDFLREEWTSRFPSRVMNERRDDWAIGTPGTRQRPGKINPV